MDGASGWYTFWHITLPLLRPTIALAVMFRVLQAFGLFDLPYVMTGGGPGTATTSLAVLGLQRAVQEPRLRARRRRRDQHRAAGAPRLPGYRCGCSGSRSDRKATDMRNRKRVGWHRYINGVNIATLVTALFILLPLYWLIASQLQDPERRSATARLSSARPAQRGELQQRVRRLRLRDLLQELADRHARRHRARADPGHAGRLRARPAADAGQVHHAGDPADDLGLPGGRGDRAAVPADARPQLAEQLPGADHPVHGLQPAVRHLDPAELHARHPEGDGGDRPDRRRLPAAHGLDDHLAAGAAGPVHGGHLLLHRLLDRVPDGADVQQLQQLPDHPGGHRRIRRELPGRRTGPSSRPASWRWCPSASWSSSSASS